MDKEDIVKAIKTIDATIESDYTYNMGKEFWLIDDTAGTLLALSKVEKLIVLRNYFKELLKEFDMEDDK